MANTHTPALDDTHYHRFMVGDWLVETDQGKMTRDAGSVRCNADAFSEQGRLEEKSFPGRISSRQPPNPKPSPDTGCRPGPARRPSCFVDEYPDDVPMPTRRPGDVPDFPRFVHVENTNACPACCIICPMDSMTRKTGIMGIDLFEQLVRQCARHGGVEQLHLHGFGEPLADKAVAAKVVFAKDQGIPYTYMVTTANSLSKKLAQNLVTAGLDGIKFSFYGMTAETYEKNHRRVSFHRTVANIENFFRIRDELGASGPEVRFQFSRDLAPEGEFEQLLRHWRPLMDRDRGDRFVVPGLHNWAGGKDYAELRLPEAERHCNWPFRDMQILWDGRIVPCVFDYDGSVVLGDAKRTALYDIWHSPAYQQLREVWRTRRSSSVPLCAQCDDPEGVSHPVKVEKALQPRRRGVVPDRKSRTGLGRLFHFRR